jgi:hypothetical protein
MYAAFWVKVIVVIVSFTKHVVKKHLNTTITCELLSPVRSYGPPID